MNTYTSKLHSPAWKAKRNLIVHRDNNKCVLCRNRKNLHVHHIKYTGEPWEAPNDDLVTLCGSCHQRQHKVKETLTPGFGGAYGLGTFNLISNYALRKAFADLAEAMQTIGPLITMVKNENQVIFRPAALATELGVSKATVERHISKARQLGLIEPDGIEHGVTQGFRVWRLCPFLAWQGTGNALRDYLRTLPANHPWFDYQDPDLS